MTSSTWTMTSEGGDQEVPRGVLAGCAGAAQGVEEEEEGASPLGPCPQLMAAEPALALVTY